MASGSYTIETSTDGVTWTQLSNVQQISASIGKNAFIDPWRPSSMTFTMRYPNGYYTPNTALVQGTQVRLKRVGATYTMWTGRIANVFVKYGIPYNTTTHVGNADYVDVECEGALAVAGRLAGNNTAITSANAYYALAQAASAGGFSIGTTYDSTNSPLVSASTVTNSYAEWLNLFAQTLGSTIKDGSGQIGVFTKDFIGTLPVQFSDTANNSTNQVYEKIEWSAQVENYFTQVIINTSAYGTVTASSGSAPYRTLQLSTINGSASQATDLANFYLNTYNTPQTVIYALTCRSESQNSWALDLGYSWYDILGYRTNVTFRGSTYYMSIIGSTMQATPETSTFTYYLASAAFLPFFILNDPQYGVLGTNRLSW